MSSELFDLERLPPRDEYGFTFHPDLQDDRWQHPEFEEYLNPEAFAEAGLETAQVEMESDVDDEHPAYKEWDSNGVGCALWEPSQPPGEGWRLIAIYDSEDSPVALYVRELVRGHA